MLRAAEEGQPLTLDFADHVFSDPAGAVLLGAAGARYYRRGKHKPALVSWQGKSYLARFGLKKLLGHSEDFRVPWKAKSDDFIGLTEITDARQRAKVCQQVQDVLHIKHTGAANLLKYALEEILRNVDDHADSPTNALMHAQRYLPEDEVILAIADTGRGVLKSLRERYHDLGSDVEAVKMALEPGVSCRNTRKGVNQGVGLTATSSMMRGVGGSLQLLSGRALLTTSQEGTFVAEVPDGAWPGVLVVMRVRGRDDIDWAQVHAQALKEVGRQ